MSPVFLLLIALGLSIAAGAASYVREYRRARMIRKMAAESNLRYSAGDRFHLSARVASHMSLCGAADVRLFDLVYSLKDQQFRCIFTAEYTQGVVRAKHRKRRVVALTELRDRTHREQSMELKMADERVGLVGQYQQMIEAGAKKSSDSIV